MNEADTCRKYVVPKLQAAGWENDPHSLTEQKSFTDGRIVVVGNKARRQGQKRADYLLRYTRDFPIAVVEAKAAYKLPGDGLQQAKDYATVLGLKFAYATNGHGIVEFDFLAGLERELTQFPKPADLWARLRDSEKLTDDAAERLLTPGYIVLGKSARYYQEIAINRAVQSVVQGQRRVLLTMATGTGKTFVAFQVCWKLWSARWNRTRDYRKPRILFLADRNILVDDPYSKMFAPFGDARAKRAPWDTCSDTWSVEPLAARLANLTSPCRKRSKTMVAIETVAWVHPPEPIRGLDHLGVQAPCIALYGQLLPGITNVTDRARYYSFHPWVIWSFERRYTDHSVDEFRRVLRRAECMFALIAIRHARVVGDNDGGLHGRAMVGRDKLLRIEEDSTFALEDYATLEGPNRYFQNKLGGLGQYYFGPLRDLRVLDHHQGAGYPGYDDDRGRKLAEAFASAVPEDAFFRVLEQPTATWEDLDELVAFCPCGLPANTAEHELLLDLFLARTEPFHGDGGTTRRASLGLMLDLASQAARDSDYAFEGLLRGGTYTGALVNGSAWHVAKPLERVLRGWGTYQRNELLSLAVQGLFAAVLRAIERDEAQSIRQASDAAEIAVRLLSSRGADLKLPLDALVTRVRGELPELADWQHEGHELQRGWRLQNLPLNDDTKLEEIAQESIAILLALLARGVDEYPYGDFELAPEYFDPREVHLLSLRHASKTEWAGLTVEAWVRWLAVQWGVARHLRVALRKLRGERRDTFRIRPLEGELRVVEAPAPVFTQPRVSRAQQILRDLGLVEYDDEGVMILTDRGRTELEACRAG